MSIERFEQLKVWRDAHALVLGVYKLTSRLPEQERFGLVSQMRRAAVSVPANIVEGFKRRGRKDKAHFYNIAQSSLEETRYFALLCRDLGHKIDYPAFESRADEIARMLSGLIRSLENK